MDIKGRKVMKYLKQMMHNKTAIVSVLMAAWFAGGAFFLFATTSRAAEKMSSDKKS